MTNGTPSPTGGRPGEGLGAAIGAPQPGLESSADAVPFPEGFLWGVATAAHQVEYTLHSQELARSVQLLNWHRAAAQPWRDRAALLLDRKGRILRANEAARPFVAEHALDFSLHRNRPVLDGS